MGEVKYNLVEGSGLPIITDLSKATFLGYEEIGRGKFKSGRIDFTKMTPLFGVSQTVDSSTTTAPCGKAVKEALETVNKTVGTKADATKADGSKVAYTDKEGKIPIGNLPLATQKTAGIITAEQFKLLDDMATNMDQLTAQLKRIADAQNGYKQDKYTGKIIVEFSNVEPTYIPSFLGFVGAGDYRVSSEGFAFEGTTLGNGQINYISSFLPTTNAIVTVDFSTQLQVHIAKSDIIDNVVISSPTLAYIASNEGNPKYLDCRNVPKLDTLYAHSERTEYVDLSGNTILKNAYITAIKQEKLDLTFNVKLKTLTISRECPSLWNIILPSNTDELAILNIAKTNISKDVIMENIGKVWTSRVGKTAGVLTIKLVILSAMTENEKMTFTNKNINLIGA